MRVLFRAICGGAFLWLFGFVWFVQTLPREQASSVVDELAAAPTDNTGIVALTGGGGTRIKAAVDLLAQEEGEKLLISGVHPDAQKHELAAHHPEKEVLFDCCVDLGKDAQTTTGNAMETSAWIAENNFDRVIIVTTDYHMPRAIAEIRMMMPDKEVLAYPVASAKVPQDNWFLSLPALKILSLEYTKFLTVKAGHLFPVLRQLQPA
jgi:uncharacterized SAM-binding protein YcdF (DUF218 family)